MNPDMLLLQRGAMLMGLELTRAQLELFDLYQKELRLWNAKTNLISQSTESEIVTRHFLDSLTACKFVTKQDARIVDIGCGAGFPGIPLKIALPSLHLYLLESNRKKVSFLKHIIRQLNLSDTITLNDRTENIVKTGQYREQFDIVTSRAALKLPDLLFLSNYFLAPCGLLISFKGPDVTDELEALHGSKKEQIFNHINQYDIDFPLIGPPRKIILFQKPDFSKKAF